MAIRMRSVPTTLREPTPESVIPVLDRSITAAPALHMRSAVASSTTVTPAPVSRSEPSSRWCSPFRSWYVRSSNTAGMLGTRFEPCSGPSTTSEVRSSRSLGSLLLAAWSHCSAGTAAAVIEPVALVATSGPPWADHGITWVEQSRFGSGGPDAALLADDSP